MGLNEMIEVFNTLEEASDYMYYYADDRRPPYFKGELLLLPDGRWRVGIVTEPQLELPFDGFNE